MPAQKMLFPALLLILLLYLLCFSGKSGPGRVAVLDPLVSSGSFSRIGSGIVKRKAAGERMVRYGGILSRINTKLTDRDLATYRTDNAVFLTGKSVLSFLYTGEQPAVFTAGIHPLDGGTPIHWSVEGTGGKRGGRGCTGLRIPVSAGNRVLLFADGGAYSIRSPRFIPEHSRKRVILHIVVDAMRTDALANLGGRSAAAPNLDRLCREATTYSSAYVPANWTRPSTVAFLTGLYPARTHIPVTIYGLTGSHKYVYEKMGVLSLPLALRRWGWYTTAVVNNVFLIGTTPLGLDMGFNSVLDIRKDGPDSNWLTRQTIAEIERHTDGPLYLFVNYNAPHAPYTPAKRFLRRIRKGLPDHYRRYMGEVASCDYQIGRLIAHLKKRGLYRSATIIVHSDHGEILEERHSRAAFFSYMIRYTHGESAYQEEIRVPLILKYPEGHKLHGEAMRTELFSLAGLPALISDIVRDRRKNPFPASRTFLSRQGYLFFQGRCLEAVTDGRYVYSRRYPGVDRVQYRPGGSRYQVPEELYDLIKDPLENRNLSSLRYTLLEKLRKELAEHPLRPRPGKVRFRLPLSGRYCIRVALQSGHFYRIPPGVTGISVSSNICTFFTQVKNSALEFALSVQPPRFFGSISIRRNGKEVIPLMGAFGLPLYGSRVLIQNDMDLRLQGPLQHHPGDQVSIWFSGLKAGTRGDKGAAVSGQMRDMLRSWGYIQ